MLGGTRAEHLVERRRMNWRWALAVSAVLGLGYSGLIARGRLRVDRQVVVVSRARIDFSLRILHLSDLHVDGHSLFRRWRLRRLAPTLRALRFDVLVFSGDLIDDEGGVEAGVAFLGQVAGGRPAFAVLGNHDYHHYPWWQNILDVHVLRDRGLVSDVPIDQDVARIERLYASAGIELLTNRGRLLCLNGTEFWLAGVDDLLMGKPNLNRTVAAEGAPAEPSRVLIAHHPDLFPWAEMAGFDLVLSGHTHGGQIRLPFVGPVLTGSSLERRMIAGLTRNHHGTLHVSRGLGETIPVRFNCPLHATVVEVRG
jgi:predicted MPP superfamily phosphohydrolase